LDDLKERNLLVQTFKKRHLPLSDGNDHFDGKLPCPPEWLVDKPTATTSTPSPTSSKKTKRPVKRKAEVKLEPNNNQPMAPVMFDKSTGTFSDIVDLSDV
jgi:hypothetical protein